MCSTSERATGEHRWLRRLKLILLTATLLLAGSVPTWAQNNFSSGSTGSDGLFSPTGNQTLQVPASGVFNFTTINVPAGVTITFARNALNTPVTLLATGNVTIAGSLVLSGQPGANGPAGLGGPGGFDGGIGGFGLDTYSGNPGNGPGGGGAGKKGVTYSGGGGGGGFLTAGGLGGNTPNDAPGAGGLPYGTITLLPLIGGSGGGGGGGSASVRGTSGGGGGGALLIASSGNITFSGSGTISAPGGNGGNAAGYDSGAGGGGSGGAIRLIANTISGSATLSVNGGTGGGGCQGGGCGGSGGLGYVRVEAYDYGAFSSNVPPSGLSFAPPNPPVLTNAPQLQITSVAGVAAPGSPLGSFQAVPDVIVPASQANPVTVALGAANIPIGTVIQVALIPTSGAVTTVSSSPLFGTVAASTATASLSLPAGMSVLSATATIDLTIARLRPLFIEGERVNRIEVAAVYGGGSKVTYITQSGRRIKAE